MISEMISEAGLDHSLPLAKGTMQKLQKLSQPWVMGTKAWISESMSGGREKCLRLGLGFGDLRWRRAGRVWRSWMSKVKSRPGSMALRVLFP